MMKKKTALLLAALLLAGSTAFGCAKKDTPVSDTQTDLVTPAEDQAADADHTQSNGEGDEENSPSQDEAQTEDKNDTASAEEKPSEKPSEKPAEKPSEKPTEKPSEKPAEKPSEKPGNSEQPEVPEAPSPDTSLPSDNAGSVGNTVDLSGKTAAEIIDMIYEKKPISLFLDTQTLDLTDADSVKYNTGLTNVDGIKEIAVSEPMMSSQAYSLVLVRVNDSANAASVAKAIKDGINPAKWVCVEADELKAATSGDLVLFFMIQSSFADTVTVNEMVDAFRSVCGSIDYES